MSQIRLCPICNTELPEKAWKTRKYCSERCKSASSYPRAAAYARSEAGRAVRRRIRLKYEKTSASYLLRNRLKARIHKALKCVGLRKNSKTADLIGCDFDTFRAHIESQFKRGMRWDNLGKVWHIDHIAPVSKFNLSDPADQRRAFHFSNMRPLRVLENLTKHDSIIPHQPELLIRINV